VEEMRDLAEATVEEEVAMEEEVEVEGMAGEEVEVAAEDMAVGAAVATEEEEEDTAGRVAEEASNAIEARYLWRRAKKSMLQLIRLVGEAMESPVSTTL
jgi:hypothetical protein